MRAVGGHSATWEHVHFLLETKITLGGRESVASCIQDKCCNGRASLKIRFLGVKWLIIRLLWRAVPKSAQLCADLEQIT